MSLFLQRMKPAKFLWTQTWRRMHKKLKTEEITKKRVRRTTKFQRGVVGVSAEEIAARRNQKPEVRAAQRESNLRDIKERNKVKKDKAAAARKAAMKNTHKKR
jgi:large subunit ribosomal protein L24e